MNGCNAARRNSEGRKFVFLGILDTEKPRNQWRINRLCRVCTVQPCNGTGHPTDNQSQYKDS